MSGCRHQNHFLLAGTQLLVDEFGAFRIHRRIVSPLNEDNRTLHIGQTPIQFLHHDAQLVQTSDGLVPVVDVGMLRFGNSKGHDAFKG